MIISAITQDAVKFFFILEQTYKKNCGMFEQCEMKITRTFYEEESFG